MGLTQDRLRQNLGQVYGQRDDALLSVMLQMFADAIDAAHANGMNGAAQVYLTKASGEYLDLWGEWFGVARKTSEIDSAYADRIIAETIQLRCTNLALEDIVKKAYGYTAHVRDLWSFVLHSDTWASPIGHPAHVSDGHLAATYGAWNEMGTRSLGYPYSPGVIGVWIEVPSAEYPIVTSPIMELIERHRAAGTQAVLMGQISV